MKWISRKTIEWYKKSAVRRGELSVLPVLLLLVGGLLLLPIERAHAQDGVEGCNGDGSGCSVLGQEPQQIAKAPCGGHGAVTIDGQCRRLDPSAAQIDFENCVSDALPTAGFPALTGTAAAYSPSFIEKLEKRRLSQAVIQQIKKAIQRVLQSIINYRKVFKTGNVPAIRRLYKIQLKAFRDLRLLNDQYKVFTEEEITELLRQASTVDKILKERATQGTPLGEITVDWRVSRGAMAGITLGVTYGLPLFMIYLSCGIDSMKYLPYSAVSACSDEALLTEVCLSENEESPDQDPIEQALAWPFGDEDLTVADAGTNDTGSDVDEG